MRTRFETLDDLQHEVLARLLKRKANALTATRGATREIEGALLELRNPRARLSRSSTRGKIFSCLGEALWYLSASDDLKFISYYIPQYADESSDGISVKGAYGPRIFGGSPSQFTSILELLSNRQSSRRAVIQIFDHADLTNDKEVPCTTSLQFLIRSSKLDLIATMRSNDAYKGLPHDIFAFTFIQEVAARSLGVEVGTYKHFVASLHLYEDDIPSATAYVAEGLQQRISMPPMPIGDPMLKLHEALVAEESIRLGKNYRTTLDNAPYWRDIVILLRAYKYTKTRNHNGLERMRAALEASVYHPYIDSKVRSIPQSNALPHQAGFTFNDRGDGSTKHAKSR